MKYGIIIGGSLIVLLGFYFGQTPIETEKSISVDVNTGIENTANVLSSKLQDLPIELPGESEPGASLLVTTDDDISIEEIKTRAEQKKKELELMMSEFEENIADSEARKLLKPKMDLALKDYNKLILPLALEKMK
jgi:hypothetical protein